MAIKNNMFTWILVSIALGIFFGVEYPKEMIEIQWVGQLFINLLKLIVLPLIFSALVSAIASIGGMQRLSTIGLYTFCYVMFSVAVAVVIGLVLLNTFKPGVHIPPSLIMANATPADIEPMPLSRYILTLFPPNIVEAAVKYELMPIVFFSIVFALAAINVGKTSKVVIDFFIGLRNILIKMIIWLMYLTPIGLFSLLGTAVAEASIEHLLLQSLRAMIAFIFVFLGGLALQISWQIALATYLTRSRPTEFLSKASNALVTAFATSSSMATLPVTMLVAKEQKVSDDVAKFVLPLATTINLAGTAMYEAVSALFFCQILDLHLSIPAQIGVFITAILAGMGSTGIPEGGLITMVMVLRNVNVPTSAIGLLLPFDRILDRFRTMTNVCGDLVCAITVDHLQKAQEKRAKRRPRRRIKR